MKRVALLAVLLTGGIMAQPIPKSVIEKHPRMQEICTRVGGCQNVRWKCTRYGSDGTGDNARLNNKTFVEIRTGDSVTEDYGIGLFRNDEPGFDSAVEDAIDAYWRHISEREERKRSRTPSATDCSEDCGTRRHP